MKKILIVISALILIATFGTTTVLAYEGSADTTAAEDNSDSSQNRVLTESESAPDTDVAAPNTDSNADNTENSNETEEKEKSWADDIYEIALDNADKIFALLACISSLLVGFAYRKGLLPLVKNALTALGNGVTSLKEQNEKTDEITRNILEDAEHKLREAEECVNSISERLASLESEISKANEESMRDRELRLILNAQIDMLYQIFMSSSLPSYQKDAIGERVAEMKRAIGEETEQN